MIPENPTKSSYFWLKLGVCSLLMFAILLFFAPKQLQQRVAGMFGFDISHDSLDGTGGNQDAFGKIISSGLVQPESTTLELAKVKTSPVPFISQTPRPSIVPSSYPTPKPSKNYQAPVYTQNEVKLRTELWPVCACETSYAGTKYGRARHFENGSVIRGYKSPEDIGMCQISLTWHGQRAGDLGYDLFDEADNITYANYLYSVEGTIPWYRSQFCWMKP